MQSKKSVFRNIFGKNGLLVVLVAWGLSACTNAPRRTLSSEEKMADLYWMFSQFGQNYAPLKMKEGLHGFNYAELKKEALAVSEKADSNTEFYLLLHKFIGRFKDAHTSGSLSDASFEGRTKVAYLGFSGIRSGSEFVVRNFMPSMNDGKGFLIKKEERITKVNGVPFKEAVLKELADYRNLGDDEANFTYLAPRFFGRVSSKLPLPKESTIVLTVKGSNGKEREQELPWVVKDLVDFQKDQASYKKDKDSSVAANLNAAVQPAMQYGLAYFQLGFEWVESFFQKFSPKMKGYQFWNSFVFLDDMPVWDAELPAILRVAQRQKLQEAAKKAGVPLLETKKPTTESVLKGKRYLPSKYFMIESAEIFPAYIASISAKTAEGKETTKLVGYIHIDTFSPDADDADVLKELQKTLNHFRFFNIQDVVLDLIDNGGGSLKLGIAMAQYLTPKTLVQPEIQFRLSETWLDQFEQDSLSGGRNDIEKELYRRVLVAMKEDLANKQWLSRRFSMEALFPYAFEKNKDLVEPLNILVVINEMCASMCEIFSAAVQDNQMAKVLGTKSMGAGGNVVQHFSAPNSGLVLSQTESLMLRKDGSYVENAGVTPDYPFPVVEDADRKYEKTLKKAFEILVPSSVAASPTPAPSASPSPSVAQ